MCKQLLFTHYTVFELVAALFPVVFSVTLHEKLECKLTQSLCFYYYYFFGPRPRSVSEVSTPSASPILSFGPGQQRPGFIA